MSVSKPDRVSYGQPRLTCRQMYWSICPLLLDWHSTHTLVSYIAIDQESINSPLLNWSNVHHVPMSADISTVMSSVAYWSTTGQLSFNYWSTTSDTLVNCRSCVS